MSDKQNVTNDIKVPNNDLEVLKKHFSHCFDKDGNFQIEKFTKNLGEKEINFSTESYGMDWLGKSYARLLASDPATTLLKADETHNAKPENANAQNLLLKGDNLEVLKHLSNAYHEKIKMIYIDPPYNTGGDGFVYQDDRKFSLKELEQLAGVNTEKAKRILDFTKSKSNSHSAWLTFMYPRLYIAKQLLKDDGVIFISIDDNEVAQLRLLMDEVFGEENFVACICHKSRASVSNDKIISENHNYILFFAKDKNNIFQFRTQFGLEQNLNDFKEEDERGKFKFVPVSAPGGSKKGNPFYSFKGIEGYFRFSEETMNKMFNEGFIEIKGKTILQKYYLSKAEKTRKTDTTWWDDGFYTSSATGTLNKLMGKEVFTNPKAIEAIKKMLILINSKDLNSLILDFFAGSGTTGDAVMQLNAEDSGNRKFILVQIPELIDPKRNPESYSFVKELAHSEGSEQEPTIFEITKERLIRAAKKINGELDGKNIGLEAKIKILESELPTDESKEEIENLRKQIIQNVALKAQNTFKVFGTMPIWEDYDFESTELDNQAVLFDESKLSEEDLRALLVTWKTYDTIALTQDLEQIDLNGYAAHYGNGKLYLMNKGFTTDNLTVLLEKIDEDNSFDPKSIIAFGYHFDSKNLRELSESVKSYSNGKKSDIAFITRY